MKRLSEWLSNEKLYASINAGNRQVLKVDSRKQKLTMTQATALQDRHTSLLRKIQKFRDVQDVYMPGLRHFLDQTQGDLAEQERDTHSENLAIHLPSSLSSADRTTIYIPGVVDVEDRLRYGEACEALESLRRQLRTRTFTTKFKAKHVVGQGAYTRTRVLQDQIEAKLRVARARYCAARAALLALRGPGEWEEVLQVLKAEDVRALNERTLTVEEKDAEERARQLAGVVDSTDDQDPDRSIEVRPIGVVEIGEGRRQLSWIWYRVSAGEVERHGAGTLHEGKGFCLFIYLLLLNATVFNYTGIRLEWAKCRARAERWHEELILLEEEMRRIIEFCNWKAAWWDGQADRRSNMSPHLREGIRAYAAEQAATERRLARVWALKWNMVRQRARVALEAGASDVADELEEVGPEIEVVLQADEDIGEEDFAGYEDDD